MHGALAEIRIEPISQSSQRRSPNAPGAIDVKDVVTGRGPIKAWCGIVRHGRERGWLGWLRHRELTRTWTEVVIHVVASRVPKPVNIPEASYEIIFGAPFRLLVALQTPRVCFVVKML